MFHTILIVGNLGRDPEMRYTPTGEAVTNMNVAANRTYKNSSGAEVKETIWFRVSAWGKQAENCNQYLKKGSKVLVEGRLVPDQATGGPKTFTRQDGTVGAAFEVSASTIRFLSSKEETEAAAAGQPPEEETEIPF